MKTSINKIIAGMESCNQESSFYYVSKTNEIIIAEMMDEADFEFDDLIMLPNQAEINEYDMMATFVETLKEDDKKKILTVALNGPGAFRRFKDCVYDLGINKDWFRYRDIEYKKIAIKWCQDNNLQYIDDYKIKEEQ